MKTGKLDTLDRDDLMSFWSRVHRHPVREARKLFPKRPKHYVKATTGLAAYASNRTAMLSCKKRGDARGTLVYQRICDIIRDDLPAYVVQ